MTIPNLPTDNFYKFVALSGIALIVFTVFFYFSQLGEVRTGIQEIKSESNLLHLDIDFLKEDLNLPDTMKIKEVQAYLEDTVKRTSLYQSRELVREFQRKVTQINDKLELHQERVDDFKLVSGVTMAFIIIGIWPALDSKTGLTKSKNRWTNAFNWN